MVPQLEGRTLWMVNSTARGGGVAEMLPRLVTILRELGVRTEWLVIGSDKPEFFTLTKRLHNLIHGNGVPEFSADDQAVYHAVSRENADGLKAHVKPGDLLVTHDPQPLGSGALVRQEYGRAGHLPLSHWSRRIECADTRRVELSQATCRRL